MTPAVPCCLLRARQPRKLKDEHLWRDVHEGKEAVTLPRRPTWCWREGRERKLHSLFLVTVWCAPGTQVMAGRKASGREGKEKRSTRKRREDEESTATRILSPAAFAAALNLLEVQ